MCWNIAGLEEVLLGCVGTVLANFWEEIVKEPQFWRIVRMVSLCGWHFLSDQEQKQSFWFPAVLKQQAYQYIFHDGIRRESGDSVFGCSCQTHLFHNRLQVKDFQWFRYQVGTVYHKTYLIRTLTYRCLRVCSTTTLLQASLSGLKRTLLQNGYRNGIVSYNVNDVLKKFSHRSSEPVSTVTKKDAVIVLP